eukprot:2222300-Prorocentrum_lima.AAC.1
MQAAAREQQHCSGRRRRQPCHAASRGVRLADDNHMGGRAGSETWRAGPSAHKQTHILFNQY